MNAKTLIPLSAAALFAIVAGSLVAAHSSSATHAPVASATAQNSIVDLPAVTVRPSFEDAAYFQANKIVDLAAITVRPEASDMAAFLADNSARIVDMPVVTVRPTVEDIQIVAVGVAALAQQLASR